ncbi:MAG: PorT family protein [Candidatus Marinimicrobia bacterium]|nr:PorT family protein [Candidatus Neomarinimicrobiota bacterium]
MKNLIMLMAVVSGLSFGLAEEGMASDTDRANTGSKYSLAIMDVPLDSIPDTIYLMDKNIVAPILGFLPKGSDNPKALVYQTSITGPSIKISFSKVVRIDDGQTGLSIILPSPSPNSFKKDVLAMPVISGLSQWVDKNDIFALEGLRLSVGNAYQKDIIGYTPGLKFGIERTLLSGTFVGISYTQREWAYLRENNSEGFTRMHDYKFNLNYLSFHIAKNLSVRKFNLFAGIELGYLVGGKVQEDLTGTFEGNTFAFSDPTVPIEKEDWKQEGRATLDYGLLLGTRYDLFKHIGIAASYYYGIPDIGGGIMIGNRSLQVSMSYSL